MVALIATGIAISSKYGTPSIFNPGPQGFSETLYAYTSQANNNGSALAGYTGFVQPNAPGNAGSYGISFADILGGLSMLTARFVPLLSALAVAGSFVDEARRTCRTRDVPNRHPDLRDPAARGDRDRRRPHLLPRRPARPGRPGPHQPTRIPHLTGQVRHARDFIASIIAALAFTVIFGLAYPLIATGVSQVLFPNKSDGSQVKLDGKTVGSKLIGQSFTHSPPDSEGPARKFGKKQIKTPDPKYFQPRPSATTYSPDVTFFNNLGPEQQGR